MRTSLLIGVLVVAGATGARAQAWPQEAGRVYVKLAYGAATAAEQFTFDGRARPFADGVDDDAYFDRSLYLYAEGGLTRHVTLIGALPLRRVFVRDPAFRYRTYGVGSAMLGARVGLRRWLGWENGPNALSASAAVTVPTGYTRNRTPSVGAGQVDYEVALAYGRSFYPLPAYAQASAGFRKRTSVYRFSEAVACQEGVDLDCFADRRPDYGDEFTASAEAGYTLDVDGPMPRVLVQALGRAVWSVEAPTTAFTVANPIPTHQRAVKVGGGVTIYGPYGIGVGVQAFATPYGQNTVRSIDLFLGVEASVNL